MFLLDTDVLIWAIRGRKDVVEALQALKELGTTAVSPVSVGEIYQNIFPGELTETEDFFLRHDVYLVDYKVAKQAGLYRQQYIKMVAKLSLDDCFIAATAKLNGLKLLTLNRKHFPMKDLEVVSPFSVVEKS